jgi:hypothetical protein
MDPSEQVPGMGRQPDRPAGVGNSPTDRLSDPPGGIRRELEAFVPVELSDRVDQAQVPFLDQIEKGETGRLVPLGDRHDQPQIRLDEGLTCLFALQDRSAKFTSLGRAQLGRRCFRGRCLAARVDHLGQLSLLELGQQRVLSDTPQIELDDVRLVALGPLIRKQPNASSARRDRNPPFGAKVGN